MADPLRAFSVGCNRGACDWDHCQVAFAPSALEARKLADGTCDGGCDYIDLRAVRAPKGDQYLDPKATEPYLAGNEVLRRLGWRLEGDVACATCGLHSFDMKKYTPCDECEQCPECGHDEGCSKRVLEVSHG